MSSANLPDLERAVEAFLTKETSITPERIREWIEKFRVMPMFAVADEDAEILARRLEVRHDVTMTIGSVLTE